MNKGTSLYLDLVRFSAAAVVFIQHAKALSRDSFLGFWVNHPNVYSLINVLSQAAVTVFFVLSGYVIAHVLATRERTPLDYAASRFGRLYSVVIPALIVTTLCNYVLSQPHALVSGYGLRVLANLTFTNSFWLPADLSIGNLPLWSLSFEVAYYVAIALVLFTRDWTRLASIAALTLAAGPSIVLLAPTWAGGYFAYCVSRRRQMRPIPASMLWVAGTAVTLFSCWIELHIHFPLLWLKTPDRNLGYLVAAYVATLGFAASLIAFNNLGQTVGVVLGPFERAIRWLGSLTFALYLFHVPLLSLFSAYLRGHIVLAMMATLAIVCTLGRFCEKSKTAYKRAFAAIVGRLNPQPIPVSR